MRAAELEPNKVIVTFSKLGRKVGDFFEKEKEELVMKISFLELCFMRN